MTTHLAYADLHCHLDLFPDFASAVEEIERAKVYALTVTTTPRAWPRNRELTENKRYVRAALGLHPQLVQDHADDIHLWEMYLAETRYVGEVGIDRGPRYYRSLDKQKDIFAHVLQSCGRAGDKILTVHSVRSARIVLDLVEEHLPARAGKVILHWFTGSKSEAQRAVELGCHFSINTQMASNERGRELIRSLPCDRLLTETDSPFTQIDGRTASPLDIGKSVQLIAELLKSTPEEVAAIVFENLKRLLGTSSMGET
jgi:TatD DNase family protein